MKLENSILKVLVYFDMFQYPVTYEEIKFFIELRTSDFELSSMLNQMLREGQIFRLNEFYSLQNNYALAERRIKGNQHAGHLLQRAYKISEFLFLFPFVRGIGISGSLSKNFADPNADIDFFLITKSNRLWISRTFLHLFKKLTFLVKKQHWFCMNYFVDEDAMLIEEKNVFTAMELITLLPACGNGSLGKFFSANDWAREYYPNYRYRNFSANKTMHNPWYKKMIEWLFDNWLGDRLDDYFFRLTSKRWKKKEEEMRLNIKGNRMGIRTGKHFSKPNPNHFQEKILMLYYSRLREFDIGEQVGVS